MVGLAFIKRQLLLPTLFPDFSGHILADGRYVILKIIGEGSFGQVYKAVDMSLRQRPLVAIKVMAKCRAGSRGDKLQRREFQFHEKVASHPNIVDLHERIYKGDYIFVVLGYCNGGDLRMEIARKDVFYDKTDRVKDIMVQIIDALEHCHRNGVYHRDLKPANILLHNNELTNQEEIYLADFGLATDNDLSKEIGCGTASFLSPECLLSRKTLYRQFSAVHSDIWALGIILCNIITRVRPWAIATKADYHFRTFVKDPDYLHLTLPMSPAASRILRGIFTVNPLARPSLSDLREQILAVDTFFISREEMRSRANQKYSAPPVHHISLDTPEASIANESDDSTLGPLTPETNAVELAVEVPDLDIGESRARRRSFIDKFFSGLPAPNQSEPPVAEKRHSLAEKRRSIGRVLGLA
ncbi:kinase-like domain-containing protein [Mycena floridula]|nr:kinase-like domain-containing protein [Mycena floridula]